MMPPPAGTAKNWAAYRDRFVEPQRIAAGTRFWQDNAEWLQRAEERWGVPAQIIVGIVGVETFYGRITGNFRVLDVLATLSFDFPTGRSDRSAFFRDELEAFLLLSRREGLDPTLPKGSFAGAMGLPQFMPSSINRYAVDFDGDGRIDLANSTADVIGSVANYLAAFGWQRGMPTQYEVAVPVDTSAAPRCWHPTSCRASVPSRWWRWAPNSGPPRARTMARWRWWKCRTAPPRPATWPARRTSTS